VSGSKGPEKEERYRPLRMKLARTATKRAMLSKMGPARASVVRRNSYVACWVGREGVNTKVTWITTANHSDAMLV
jgi:hypothetical protein